MNAIMINSNEMHSSVVPSAIGSQSEFLCLECYIGVAFSIEFIEPLLLTFSEKAY